MSDSDLEQVRELVDAALSELHVVFRTYIYSQNVDVALVRVPQGTEDVAAALDDARSAWTRDISARYAIVPVSDLENADFTCLFRVRDHEPTGTVTLEF